MTVINRPPDHNTPEYTDDLSILGAFSNNSVNMIDHLPMAVFLLDQHQIILHANSAFGLLTGKPTEEMVGLKFNDLVDDFCEAGTIRLKINGLLPVFDIHCFQTIWQSQPATLVILQNSDEKKTNGGVSQEKEDLEARISERTSRLEKLTQELEAEITDRKAVEQALRQSEERYRTLYDEVPVGLFRISPGGDFLDVNSVLIKMLGMDSLKTFLASRAEDFYVLPQNHRLLLNAVIKSGYIQQKTVQFRCADGTSFWGEVNAQAIRDKYGKIQYFQGSVQNISGRIDVEKVQNAVYRISEAAASTQNLEDLYPLVHTIIGELIPAKNFYIALFDPEMNTVTFPYYVDQSDTPVLPDQMFTMQEMERGLTWHLIRSGQPVLLTQGAFQTLIEQGEVSRIGVVCEEYLGVPLKTPDDKIIGAIAAQTYIPGETYSIRDQEMLSFVSTQIAIAIIRKRAEETLQLQVEALDSTVNNIVVVDLAGKILWANRAFCLFMGIPLDKVGKYSLPELYNDSTNNRAFEEIFEQIASGQNWQGELSFTQKKGDVFVNDVSFTPVHSNNSSQITRLYCRFTRYYRPETHRNFGAGPQSGNGIDCPGLSY